MNKDRDERTEEQVQFLDGAEAFRGLHPLPDTPSLGRCL